VPIVGRRTPFTPAEIDAVPRENGVFALYRGAELTYIGAATGPLMLPAALMRHHDGIHGPGTRDSTHFAYEETDDAADRAADLLAEFRAANGHLPLCN
jgi:hypothetical protein